MSRQKTTGRHEVWPSAKDFVALLATGAQSACGGEHRQSVILPRIPSKLQGGISHLSSVFSPFIPLLTGVMSLDPRRDQSGQAGKTDEGLAIGRSLFAEPIGENILDVLITLRERLERAHRLTNRDERLVVPAIDAPGTVETKCETKQANYQ
jgi:hypothetical protein